MKIFSNPLKSQKVFKIVILNLIIIILLIGMTDFLIYNKLKKDYIDATLAIDIFPPISYIDNYKADYSHQSYMFQTKNINKFDYLRLKSTNKYINKNSILLFGCSFTYGYGLKDNQTINSKLSEKLNRNVYNFGICASGIQHMLFFIKNKNLYNKIKEPPSHVIYTFIPNHLERIQANIFPSPMTTNGLILKYKIKNEEPHLVISPFNFLSKTFIIKSLFYQLDLKRDNCNIKNKEYNAKLAYKMFVESKKLLEQKYPNIKFVILRYEVEEDNSENIELPSMWNDLEKEGFIIIKSSDLIGRKFKYHSEDTNEDFYHPSEKAWDLLVPQLIKKLNLE